MKFGQAEWQVYKEQGATIPLHDPIPLADPMDDPGWTTVADLIPQGQVPICPTPELSFVDRTGEQLWVTEPPSIMEGLRTTLKVLSDVVSHDIVEGQLVDNLKTILLDGANRTS